MACGSADGLRQPAKAEPQYIVPQSITRPALRSGAGSKLVVGEHLVGDERDAGTGAQRRQLLELGRAETNYPVGLFGLTTSTARVRGVKARFDAADIDRPRAVVFEVVRPGGHEVQAREWSNSG